MIRWGKYILFYVRIEIYFYPKQAPDWSFTLPGSEILDVDESATVTFSITPDVQALAGNIPQTILDFPLEKDKGWSFGLYGKEQFNAMVEDVDENIAHVVATSSDPSSPYHLQDLEQ